MGISDEITALNADIAKCFNSLATFTPATGTPVSLRCELLTSVDPQPMGYDGVAWSQKTTIECLLSDLPSQPDKGETYTIDGTDYTVAEIVEDDGHFVTCEVK